MLIDYKKELLDQFTLNELHLILIKFIPYICITISIMKTQLHLLLK